jgi:hypothetical protein
MIKPPRRPLQTSAEWDRFFREALLASVGEAELQPEAVTTTAIAGAAAAANNRFYVKRANAMVLDAIAESDIPAAIARDTEVSAAIVAHEAAPDPHPQYLTQSEGDARYRELTDAVTYAEITGKPAALALIFSGTGSPEGVVTAGVGSTFHRTDGGAGTSFYVKESGAGNTGWQPK